MWAHLIAKLVSTQTTTNIELTH